MRFAALVALSVIASTVPGLAAPAPYSPRWITSKRDTASTDVNTTSVYNGTTAFRIGTAILQLLNDPVPEIEQLLSSLAVNGTGASTTLPSKRDTTSDIVDAIGELVNELPATRKRDVTADLTAALQTLLEEGGSVSSDVKRDLASSDSSGVEERGLPSSLTSGLKNAANVASIGGGLANIWNAIDGSLINSNTKRQAVTTAADGSLDNDQFPTPSIPTALLENRSLTSLLKSLGNVASIGFSASSIASALDGSGNTKRDFVPTSDEVDIAGALGGATPQFEDRSFKISPSAESALSKLANVASVGGIVASLFGGSSNSTRRDLGMDSGLIHDQKRDVSSDVENILQQIIAAYEGAINGSSSTSTSTKRFTNDSGLLNPEQLEELS
ncbi:uncharacterized protein EDB91DRAFT_1350981 [Suillus paluster]|uniref:uncharacterized protein n=1 Tax=Suillus paluster TaxID=48578 RepID=UPI001B8817B9|nr:uncharacterized protein EDB91DRAFT_1350981 [Suillus paluster]KAG1724644.1 hypothetical protein EDB91DRAFT_1350981 [Suillus paluster]